MIRPILQTSFLLRLILAGLAKERASEAPFRIVFTIRWYGASATGLQTRSPRFRRKLRTTMSGSLKGRLSGFSNFKHLLVKRLYGGTKMPRSKKKRQSRDNKKLLAVQDRIPLGIEEGVPTLQDELARTLAPRLARSSAIGESLNRKIEPTVV